jgi:acetyl/propionyl-CoA carboxylase alpha subunit
LTIRRLLIANRGEIAVRIIRACRQMEIAPVAVYSDADARALHRTMAEETGQAVRIGPAPARESYLNVEAILDACRRSDADAVHPGYGFLAENAGFAQAVVDAGLVWVGPRPGVMRVMGDKLAAKRAALAVGIPVLGGAEPLDISTPDRLRAARAEVASAGFPVLIKAAAGGGGRGMRRVDTEDELEAALLSASREAEAAFGDGRVMLEPYLADARHIEVQVVGDLYGDVRHLWERDCSVQRRHQKLIEESPAPGLNEVQRQDLCEAAAELARSVSYDSLGTLEFLVDRQGRHFFLEMNTRLQVEHGVTELVTGVNFVQLQIRLAQGGRLPDEPLPEQTSGHAIEARVYAEDPARGFLPSVGTVRVEEQPQAPGIRVDSGIHNVDIVSEHYDSLLMKVLAHGSDRADAVARLSAALAGMNIAGVSENSGFLRAVLSDPQFRAGGVPTTFLDAFDYEPLPPPSTVVAAAAFSLAATGAGWRPGASRLHLVSDAHTAAVQVEGGRAFFGGQEFLLERAGDDVLVSSDGKSATVKVSLVGRACVVQDERGTWPFRLRMLPPPHAFTGLASLTSSGGVITSPLPGLVREVRVREGEAVEQGQIVAVLEAMKMEHLIEAGAPGVVAKLLVAAGDQVQADQPLIELGET